MCPKAGRSRSVVELIGTKARQVLSPGSRGHVLAGRSRAVYLRSTNSELVWLAPGDVPMHRRGMRVAAGLPQVSTGGTYQVTDGALLVLPAVDVDLSRAATWDPPRPAVQGGRPHTDHCWHQRLASAVLRDLPEPHGYGVLLPGILNPLPSWGASVMVTPSDSAIPDQALGAVEGIARACRESDLPGILAQAEDLVGLGDGLTPSGDDLLGGVLFGLSSLRRGHEDRCSTSSGRLNSFLAWSRPRTSEISHALLRDHAEGHGSEVLERFATCLIEHRSRRAIRDAAAELVGLGYSTGWSLMTGVWTALALAPSPEASTRCQALPAPAM